MSDHVHKRFNRLFVTQRDLKECLNYLGYLKLVKFDDVVKRGLLTAAVVCYARPWSGNKSNDRANVQPQIPLEKLLSPALHVLHTRILETRMKAIAHSDFEWKTCSWVAALANGGYSTSGKFYDLLDGGIDINEFDALVEAVYSFTCDRLQTLSFEISCINNEEQ